MTELFVEFYAEANLCWEGIKDIEKMGNQEVNALVEHAHDIRRQYCPNDEVFHGYVFLNKKKAAKIFVQDGNIVLDFCSPKKDKKALRASTSNLVRKRRGKR